MSAHGKASRSTRRLSRGASGCAAVCLPDRLRWARLVLAAALAAGVLLASRLFLATRAFPRAPVLDGWPLLQAPLDVDRARRAARGAGRRRIRAAPALVGGGGHGHRADPGRRGPVALAALVLPVRGHARRPRGRARSRRHARGLAGRARRALPLEWHPEDQRDLHDAPVPLARAARRRRTAGRAPADPCSPVGWWSR